MKPTHGLVESDTSVKIVATKILLSKKCHGVRKRSVEL